MVVRRARDRRCDAPGRVWRSAGGRCATRDGGAGFRARRGARSDLHGPPRGRGPPSRGAHGDPTAGRRPDSLKLGAAGTVDLGVLDIQDLAIARERGTDLVAIGALVERPLAALIAQPSSTRPRDLDGQDRRRLRAAVGPGVRARDRRPRRRRLLESIKQVTIGFAPVSGCCRKVDAVPAFWNAEGVALRRAGCHVHEFRVEDYGAPRVPRGGARDLAQTLDARPRRSWRAAWPLVGDGDRAVLRDPVPGEARGRRAGRWRRTSELVRAQLRRRASALRAVPEASTAACSSSGRTSTPASAPSSRGGPTSPAPSPSA